MKPVAIAVLTLLILSSCITQLPSEDGDPDPTPGTGLTGSYFTSDSTLTDSRLDPTIDFSWPRGSGPSGLDDAFSAVWVGELVVPQSGEYRFSAFGDDGVRVFIAGENVLPSAAWSTWQPGESTADRVFRSDPIALEAGQRYPLRIEYYEHDWNAAVQVNWTRPDGVRETIPTEQLYPGTAALSAPSSLPFIADDGSMPDEDSDDPQTPPGNDNLQPPVPGTMLSRSFGYDGSTFRNPEIGFHRHADVGSVNTNPDTTLVRLLIRLDAYRDGSISDEYLNRISDTFDQVRSLGKKAIVRFAYNYESGGADAGADRILIHLDELAPVLEANSDVIAVFHAGFVGAWGEWHSSTNGLTSNTQTSRAERARIIEGLLAAVPESRMVQIRNPVVLSEVYPQVLGAQEAFSGSDQSRFAHKNDCFLRNPTDSGTYSRQLYEPGSDYSYYAPWREYVETLTQYTAYGGETCAYTIPGWDDNNRLSCPDAIAEMEALSIDYLNLEFDLPSIETWREGGCFDEIERRLGYRYYLTDVSITGEMARGSSGTLVLELENRGFGKLYNPRPLDIVFEPVAGAATTVRLAQDARRLLPLGGESASITRSFTVPSSMTPGEYRVLIALPDASEGLADRSEYSIRLASALGQASIWNEETGYNDLGLTVTIN